WINGHHTNLAVSMAQFSHDMGHQRTFSGTRRTGYTNDMGMTSMRMQFGQVLAGLRRFILDQCHHASKRTAVSIEKAFNYVLQGVPTPPQSSDQHECCRVQNQ